MGIGELQLYINMLEQQDGLIYNEYPVLIKKLKKEFGLNVSEEDLNRVYSSDYDEERIDREILLKNIYSW